MVETVQQSEGVAAGSRSVSCHPAEPLSASILASALAPSTLLPWVSLPDGHIAPSRPTCDAALLHAAQAVGRSQQRVAQQRLPNLLDARLQGLLGCMRIWSSRDRDGMVDCAATQWW